MGDWNRSTRECTLESLRPEVRAELRRHLAGFDLAWVLDDCRMCVETRSEKVKKGLFGGSQTVVLTALLTPAWLVWVVEEKGPVGFSVRLAGLQVEDYERTPGYKLIPDSGVQVTGFFNGWKNELENTPQSMFLGLGPEPAAAQFKAALLDAVRAAGLDDQLNALK